MSIPVAIAFGAIVFVLLFLLVYGSVVVAEAMCSILREGRK